MSSSINEIILNLFDQSAEGISVLLPRLKVLLKCDEISLVCKHSKTAANEDDFITIEDEHHHTEYFETSSNTFTNCFDNPRKLELCINQEEQLKLEFYFDDPESLAECLHSSINNFLLPHIKQSVMIARQISIQQADLAAINYVFEHHPLNVLNKPNSEHLLHNSQKQKLMATFLTAANQNINIELDKSTLIDIFNLTPSEAELANLLFKGLSLQETAAHRNVSKQTIRKQLQSVLKKTGSDCQEKLMLRMFETFITRLSKHSSHEPALHERSSK